MSNRPLTMLQIRRILQLKASGKSNREIARELHLARNTVNGYVQQLLDLNKPQEDLLKLPDEELSSLVYKELTDIQSDWRHADIQQRIPDLYDELQKPHATKMILWEEYLRQVPEGYGYTQFCEHLNRFLETRMAQIVKKSNRYEPTFDELAEQWSLYYCTTLMASRVRKPRDKASAESHVNVIYNRIYAPLRNRVFHFLSELNQALWQELERFLDRNFQRRDYSRRTRFLQHEKALLLPLPAAQRL